MVVVLLRICGIQIRPVDAVARLVGRIVVDVLMTIASKPVSVHRTDLRPSGIGPVPEIAWGEHIACFYATTNDLIEVISGYFGAGLSAGEKCLWVTSDPLSADEAVERIREFIPDIDEQVSAGVVKVAEGEQWYLHGGELDDERVVRRWFAELDDAISRGFEGLRIVGNAFWLQNKYWESFSEYERGISGHVFGRRMILLCVYPLDAAKASDLLAVTKAHDFSIVRENGHWEFLESPELAAAKREIGRLENAIQILSSPFPGGNELTPRERLTLAQIVRGASSKEAARTLEISPRTVEFHRANLMRKIGARNIAELIQIVLGRRL